MTFSSVDPAPFADQRADHTQLLARAVRAAAEDGSGVAELPEGDFQALGTIELPDAPLTIRAGGRTRIRTGKQPLFRRTSHAYTRLENLHFTGAGPALRIEVRPTDVEARAFDVAHCRFGQNRGVFALELIGAREGWIDGCTFDGCSGLYRRMTVNTHVARSFFRNAERGIHDDGRGSPYSAGLRVDGCTFIGLARALEISETDWFSVQNCMIDYCDRPLELLGQDGGVVGNGTYLGSRSASPAVLIRGTKNAHANGIVISDAKLVNYALEPCDTLDVREAFNIKLRTVNLAFYTRYGLVYRNVRDLHLDDVTIAPRAGHGRASIKSLGGDDSSNFADRSAFDQPTDTEWMRYGTLTRGK